MVDDEPTAIATLEATLSGEGHELEFANHGLVALAKADSFLPDLVLLEVMMPGMNGFEVCCRLRATPQPAEVPIIILTGMVWPTKLTPLKANEKWRFSPW